MEKQLHIDTKLGKSEDGESAVVIVQFSFDSDDGEVEVVKTVEFCNEEDAVKTHQLCYDIFQDYSTADLVANAIPVTQVFTLVGGGYFAVVQFQDNPDFMAFGQKYKSKSDAKRVVDFISSIFNSVF